MSFYALKMILHSLATSPVPTTAFWIQLICWHPPEHSFNSFKLWQNKKVHWACSPFSLSCLCSLTTRQANTCGTSISSYSVGIPGQTHKVLCILSCSYLSPGNSFKLLHKEMGNIICNKSCKNSSILTEIIDNWAYAKSYREHSRDPHAAVEVAVWLWCNACELTLSSLFHYLTNIQMLNIMPERDIWRLNKP